MPAPINPRYVVNSRGQRVEVILPARQYAHLIAQVEELACIRAYDAAKASGEKAVPFDDAMKSIRRRRR